MKLKKGGKRQLIKQAVVSFDVGIYERTAIFRVEKGNEKIIQGLFCLAYDEWLENENDICGSCCCEEWLSMKATGQGYQCDYVNSVDWDE